MLQPLLERKRGPLLTYLVDKITHQSLHGHFTKKCRRLAHHDGAVPEAFNNKPQFFKLRRMREKKCAIIAVKINNLGNEKPLRRHTALDQSLFHPLINNPLMGSMLIDDDDRIFGL